MQYRLWGEMIVGGVHKSLTDAPKTSMFARCGGDTLSSKKSKGVGAVVDAVQQLGAEMRVSTSGSNSTSPAKLIDSRSKCYKQLGELKNLRDSDLLSQEEYSRERQAIMAILGNL